MWYSYIHLESTDYLDEWIIKLSSLVVWMSSESFSSSSYLSHGRHGHVIVVRAVVVNMVAMVDRTGQDKSDI